MAANEAARKKAESLAAGRAAAARAEQAKVELAARAAKAEAEAAVRAKAQLGELFGVADYPPGAVVFGVKPGQAIDPTSQIASAEVRNMIAGLLNSANAPVRQLKETVISSGHFDALMDGQSRILAEVGLADKLRGMVLVISDASCRQATVVSDAFTCVVSTRTRLFRPGNGLSPMSEISATAAGSTIAAAVKRAVEILAVRQARALRDL